MERLHFRATSLADIQAELHERDLLRDARARRRAAQANPLGRSGWAGLTILGRRILR
jgi:hypothetical protein